MNDVDRLIADALDELPAGRVRIVIDVSLGRKKKRCEIRALRDDASGKWIIHADNVDGTRLGCTVPPEAVETALRQAVDRITEGAKKANRS